MRRVAGGAGPQAIVESVLLALAAVVVLWLVGGRAGWAIAFLAVPALAVGLWTKACLGSVAEDGERVVLQRGLERLSFPRRAVIDASNTGPRVRLLLEDGSQVSVHEADTTFGAYFWELFDDVRLGRLPDREGPSEIRRERVLPRECLVGSAAWGLWTLSGLVWLWLR